MNIIPRILILFLFFFTSCEDLNTNNTNHQVNLKDIYGELEPLKERILTEEERDPMSPMKIVSSFIQGNQRFIKNNLTVRDHTKMIREAALGQTPKAVILTCSDSRIPVEDIFDKGIGDLIVIRISGNIISNEILADMEHACRELGTKVVVVMGHDNCRAIKSAIDKDKSGNLASITLKIKDVIENTKNILGPRNKQNSQFINAVIQNNIQNSIMEIRKESPILNDLEKNNRIKIVGAKYNMASGEVLFDI